jgi:hypothetical protein
MPLWNNKDSESSKPSWLTESQKRQCFRTIRGWEIPLAGQGFTNTAENIFGLTSSGTTGIPYLYRSPNFVGMTELLVAMPMDPSASGVTNDYLAGLPAGEKRGEVSAFNGTGGTNGIYGQTASGDLPNYKPYITAPVSGITNTAPGTIIYATKGITSYIPVIGADANYTDTPKAFTFALGTASTSSGLTGLSLTFGPGLSSGTLAFLYNIIQATAGTLSLTGSALATRQSLVFNQPTTVVGMTAAGSYWDPSTATSYVVNRYGGWGGITQGAAVLVVAPAAVTGNYSLRLSVFDGRASGGATGTVDFTLSITSGTSY